MSKVVASVALMAVVSTCITGTFAQQGTVVGSAQPGTMNDTFTIPYSDFNSTDVSGCGTTFAGCTGVFFEKSHGINGTVTVIDDCTFRIQGWQFDGLGPAVEWWGSKQSENDTDFPYPENALKIGELGAPGAYQTGSEHGGDSDVVVRLGKNGTGAQIEFSEDLNHISVWCEDFTVDFGNAALKCDTNTSTNGTETTSSSSDSASAGTGTTSTGTGANSGGTGTTPGGTTSTGMNTEPSAAHNLLCGMGPVGAAVAALVSLGLALL